MIRGSLITQRKYIAFILFVVFGADSNAACRDGEIMIFIDAERSTIRRSRENPHYRVMLDERFNEKVFVKFDYFWSNPTYNLTVGSILHRDNGDLFVFAERERRGPDGQRRRSDYIRFSYSRITERIDSGIFYLGHHDDYINLAGTYCQYDDFFRWP